MDNLTNTPVGRGHVPAVCRNYRPRTNLYVCTVCRFADGGDMSPPYARCSRLSVGDGVLDIPFAGTTDRARPHRYVIARALAPVAAQPFATKERYGCGVPLAGIAGIAGAISCRNYRLRTSLLSVPSAASRTARPVVVPYDGKTHPRRRARPARGMPHL